MVLSFRVVLVRPTKPQNLGSIARLMANFGVTDLVLVDPKVDLNDKEVEITARRALFIIEKAVRATSVKESLSESNLVIGTTARVGGDKNLPRTALFPSEIDPVLLSTAEKVSVVFGTESDGLSNEELAQCDLVMTIPTDPAYRAMNLSHAVAIILYHLTSLLTPLKHEHYRKANRIEKNLLIEHVDKITSLTPVKEEKKRVSREAFQNLVKRSWITGREAHTLIGLFKKLEKMLERAGKHPDEQPPDR
ncbi:MAG: RNA methyltransferase [Candidatus Odinarchaeota archaeon]